MRTKVDSKGNEILDGDKVVLTRDVDGCPKGATGTANLYSVVDKETIVIDREGKLLIFLDPPWDREYGYQYSAYPHRRLLPPEYERNHWVIPTSWCEVTSLNFNEQYTPEDNEVFE